MAPLSRVRVQRLIKDGAVLVDARIARPARVLAVGERVTVTDSATGTAGQDESGTGPATKVTAGMDVSVLYADDAIVVVSKPAGLVTHPGAGDEVSSVAGQVTGLFPDMVVAFAHDPAGGARPGIVHRLDKETTGVMVVARTPEAAANLIGQFSSRRVEKVYLAVVWGTPEQDEAIIEAPIGRDPRQRQRMSALPSGKPAVTSYRVLASGPHQSLLEARPLTGRTHQIRVHLAAIGHPVVGDGVYGKRSDEGPLMLHAWRLSFAHPGNARRISFREPPPAPFVGALERAAMSLPEDASRLVDV
jgi:23S rRNA pseudouridine1911/1915/1917 synthase